MRPIIGKWPKKYLNSAAIAFYTPWFEAAFPRGGEMSKIHGIQIYKTTFF